MVAILRRGTQGSEVGALQQQLAGAGFRPGRVDGRFGPATEAAVLAFQRASGLLADGIVGPVTWQVLNGRQDEVAPRDLSASVTVDLVAEMFPLTPIGAIRRHLPAVVAGLRAFAVVDKPMLLMALATIRAEAESFAPVAEAISRFNTSPDGQPFDLYDHRRDLGNQGPPDGSRYRGRGFVQLTGRANYVRCGEVVGAGSGLAREPDRACDPAIAGRLLGAFLAERRQPIKEALLEGDLKRARRLVNGGSHGLERFADAWRIGDRLLEDEVWVGVAAGGAPPQAT